MALLAAVADQTPTPTRFLKNCEEVGLFNELTSPFEHDFKKATEDDIKKVKMPVFSAIYVIILQIHCHLKVWGQNLSVLCKIITI